MSEPRTLVDRLNVLAEATGTPHATRSLICTESATALAAALDDNERLRAVIAEAVSEAELSNFKGDEYLDDRSLAVKERAEDVLAILAKAERS